MATLGGGSRGELQNGTVKCVRHRQISDGLVADIVDSNIVGNRIADQRRVIGRGHQLFGHADLRASSVHLHRLGHPVQLWCVRRTRTHLKSKPSRVGGDRCCHSNVVPINAIVRPQRVGRDLRAGIINVFIAAIRETRRRSGAGLHPKFRIISAVHIADNTGQCDSAIDISVIKSEDDRQSAGAAGWCIIPFRQILSAGQRDILRPMAAIGHLVLHHQGSTIKSHIEAA